MKSDEFSGKMLDDHIEVFCYCNFDYYRNLFWCFCISIYEKEKGSCSGQYCLYWNYVCAVSDTAADWQFFCIYAGSCGCISCDVCTGQKKHLSENISCSDIFFYPLACGCNGRQTGLPFRKEKVSSDERYKIIVSITNRSKRDGSFALILF